MDRGLIRVRWLGGLTCCHPHPDPDPDRCGGIRGHEEEAHQLNTINGLRSQHGGDISPQLGTLEDGALGKRPACPASPASPASPAPCGIPANHMRMNPQCPFLWQNSPYSSPVVYGIGRLILPC